MRDVVVDQLLDVFHDLAVARVRVDGHAGDVGAGGFMDCGRLGVQDEGDGEEAFDPFDLGGMLGMAFLDFLGFFFFFLEGMKSARSLPAGHDGASEEGVLLVIDADIPFSIWHVRTFNASVGLKY